MAIQEEDLRLLGLHKRPPVIRELRSVWLFIRNWPVLPIVILGLLILSGLLADVLATQDPRKGGIRDRHIPPAWTEEGTMEHILGTDHSVRDVFTRTLYGARISLAVAAAALLSGFIIGTTLGILSGYAGGWIDEIITRILFIRASSAMDLILAAIILIVTGPVLPAISFVPAKITTAFGCRSITSALNLTSICAVVWPLIPRLIYDFPEKNSG